MRQGDRYRLGDSDSAGVGERRREGELRVESARDGRSREGGRQRLTERGTDLDQGELRRREREGDRGRHGVTSEDNIQLNKEISGCGSTSRLCSLITKHAGEFNHVNVATAFRKLLLASREGMPRSVVEDALQALEQRALQTMEDFDARGIANTLHGMAKARYRPTRAALLYELGVRLREVARDCEPQHIANTLWAYATMGERPGAGVVGALEGRLRAVAGECKPQHIANTLWAACGLAIGSPHVLCGFADAIGEFLLSSADMSHFNGTDRCQLHQVFLSCSLDAQLRESLPESILSLKDRLGDACRAAFVKAGAQVIESKFQTDVSQALERMGLAVEKEYRVPKSGYSIDIRVRKISAQASSEAQGWAVEVDGPSHFLSCKSPTGATLIKRRHLELLGYNLVSVPYWEWDETRQDEKAQEAYLRSRLAGH